MYRAITLFAGLSALVAPAVLAQNATLCIFQQKQGRSADVDAGFDSSLLTQALAPRLPATLPMSVISIPGFKAKEIDDEAQRRNCSWVVIVWRNELGPDSPNFAGTLGGTQASKGGGPNLEVKGTKLGGKDLLEYSLCKGGSHKPISRGEGDEDSTYTKFAEAIVRKIQKE